MDQVMGAVAPGRRAAGPVEAGGGDAAAESAGRSRRFLARVEQRLSRALGEPGRLTEVLSSCLVSAFHRGQIRPGDRLPSIREIARLAGVDKHCVVKAYRALERMHLVESRERSGIYAASLDRLSPSVQSETAEWLTEVLAGAFDHHIRIPYLPELLKRWTAAVTVRCACIESDGDSRAMLGGEIAHQFGVEVTTVTAEALAPEGGRLEALPGEVRAADVLVTTAFHVPLATAAAAALGRPLLVATLNPEHLRTIDRHLAKRPLTVVCVDPAFGERVRSLVHRGHGDRVRVVLADDRAAVAELDPAEPVLLTRAARERLPGVPLRLLVPVSHVFSAEFARRLSAVILEVNLRRRGEAASRAVASAPPGGAAIMRTA